MGYGLKFYWGCNTERYIRMGIRGHPDYPKEEMYKISDALHRPSPVLDALFSSWDTEKQGAHPFCDVWGKGWCECTFRLNEKYTYWGQRHDWEWERGLGREVEMDLIKFMKENAALLEKQGYDEKWGGEPYTMKVIMKEMKMLMDACQLYYCEFFTYN
jgi:hypothetical protein